MSSIKGRGAQINPANRFIKNSQEHFFEDLPTQEEREDLATQNPKTKIIPVHPKTIVNKVNSPDLGFGWSLNPYQGCEHGCVYCYARNSHEYWDFSAGMDFEQNILIKEEAPELLRKAINAKSWEVSPIILAGNTDCYQPVERKLRITRSLLEVFLDYKHPVGIITKNAMIERDLDILSELAKDKLVGVVMSLTTLDEDLKRIMEPRTSSARNILRTIESLSKAGVPVSVNLAPIIPAINDHEIFNLIETVAAHGALNASYIMVRLNGQIAGIFENWLEQNFPDRKEKVLNRIRSLHGGSLNDSQFGRRMKGDGEWADLINSQFKMAKAKFMPHAGMPKLNLELFRKRPNGQTSLF